MSGFELVYHEMCEKSDLDSFIIYFYKHFSWQTGDVL